MQWVRSGIDILRSRRSLAVVEGMKKRMTTQNRSKSNINKITKCVSSNNIERSRCIHEHFTLIAQYWLVPHFHERIRAGLT